MDKRGLIEARKASILADVDASPQRNLIDFHDRLKSIARLPDIMSYRP